MNATSNDFIFSKSIFYLFRIQSCRHTLGITVSGLAKVAIFTTNVDAENQALINHKCVCGALNRHFCQTRVMPSFSHFSLIIPFSFSSLLSSLQLDVRMNFSWLMSKLFVKEIFLTELLNTSYCSGGSAHSNVY